MTKNKALNPCQAAHWCWCIGHCPILEGLQIMNWKLHTVTIGTGPKNISTKVFYPIRCVKISPLSDQLSKPEQIYCPICPCWQLLCSRVFKNTNVLVDCQTPFFMNLPPFHNHTLIPNLWKTWVHFFHFQPCLQTCNWNYKLNRYWLLHSGTGSILELGKIEIGTQQFIMDNWM